MVVAIPLCILARSATPWMAAQRVKPYTDPEVKHISTRTVYSPIPILLNGKVLNVPSASSTKATPIHYTLLDRASGPHLATASLHSLAKRAFYQGAVPTGQGLSYESLSDLTASTYRSPWLTFQDELVLSAFASLYRRSFGKGCHLQFVLDGVVVAEDHQSLPGWNGVVSARGLSTDLSGFGLVRDRAYLDRVELLHERLQWAEAEARQNG